MTKKQALVEIAVLQEALRKLPCPAPGTRWAADYIYWWFRHRYLFTRSPLTVSEERKLPGERRDPALALAGSRSTSGRRA